ncbi:RPL23B [Symbiodinium sp. CCMP2456]|nr:RPL23B [Symbiodinium sp. CCMP2456]
MEPRWRWQPLGAPNPSARTSDLSAGWAQPYERSEGREADLRDLRWRRAKGPANVHWAGILWAYHVGRRLEPCEVWMSKALASSPWLVVLLYLESMGTMGSTAARAPKLPEAVGLRALARGRWQAPLGFLNGRHLRLSASFQVALAQNIAEAGRLAVAIHLAKAAAAVAADEDSIAILRRPLRQLCSTCFESRWRLGLGLLTDLRLLRLRGEVVLPTSRAMDSNWREALTLLGIFESTWLRPTVKSFACLTHSGPWVLSLALVQSAQVRGVPGVHGIHIYGWAQGSLRWRSWRDPLQHLSQKPPKDALASVAGMRSLCDGFQLEATWQRALGIFVQHFPRFGRADAYVCCEALRVCVSGAAWTLSLRLLNTLSHKERIGMRKSRYLQSQSLAFILTIRACSWPRQWLAVLRLLGEVRLRRLQCHVGMYDAALFSLLPEKSGAGAAGGPMASRGWLWAAKLLQEASRQSLRRNPFMLQATTRSALTGRSAWAVCLELLQEALRKSLEAHWNQYRAAAEGLAKARRWDWALALLHNVAIADSLQPELGPGLQRALRISRAWQLSHRLRTKERE